jgi:LysM domain
VMEIIQGPIEIGNVVWWQVQSTYAGISGWTKGSQAGKAFIAPIPEWSTCPLSVTSRLNPGDRAMVTLKPDKPNHVRPEPRISSPAYGRLLNPGEEMIILEGVGCDDHITWRQIAATNDLVGWTGEGDIHHYWLEPVVIGHNSQPAGQYHKVRAGDTLSEIATRFGKNLEQVVTANPAITNPAQIEVDQRLWIPG